MLRKTSHRLEETIAPCISDKELTSSRYEELSKLNNKITANPSKNGPRIWWQMHTRQVLRETCSMDRRRRLGLPGGISYSISSLEFILMIILVTRASENYSSTNIRVHTKVT